jgi:tetratricopeptide (TPR) repeat protein
MPMHFSRKPLIYTAVVTLMVIGVGGLYTYRLYRIARHIDGLKPRAIAAFEAGDPVFALQLLVGYLPHHPDDIEALRTFVEVRAEVYDLDGAHITGVISACRQIIELDPTDVATKRRLAEQYAAIGYYTEALELADELLVEDSADIVSLKTKARALAGMRQYDPALACIDDYLEHEPLDVDMHIMRLRVMAAGSQPTATIVGYARSLAKKNPEHAGIVTLLGVAYQLTGDYPAAVEAYRRAAAVENADVADIARLAQRMDQVGMSDNAVRMLQQAEKATADPRVQRLLVRHLWERGEVAELSARAEGILSDQRAESETLAMLAMAQLQIGQQDMADQFIAALDKRSRQGEALAWSLLLRITRDGQPDPQRLIDAAETALVHFPNQPVFHFFRAEGLARSGQTDAAIQAWRTAAGLAPSWPLPVLRISKAFIVTDRPTLAMQFAQEAVRRGPDRLEPMLMLLESVTPQLDQLSEDQIAQIAEALKQVDVASNQTTRLLPLRISLAAREDKESAATLIRETLAADPPVSGSVCVQLAGLSRRYGLQLEQDCFDAAIERDGPNPKVALARAALAYGTTSDAEIALTGFDDMRRQAGGHVSDTGWALAHARLLAVVDDETAGEAWRDLIETHPDDVAIAIAALETPTVWADQALAGRAIATLRGEGEPNNTWREMRARLLMNRPDAGDRELAEAASLLLKSAKSSPFRTQPLPLLANCFERLNNPSRALSFLEQAQRLEPHNTRIALERIRLMQTLGQTDQAGDSLQALGRVPGLNDVERLRLAVMLNYQGWPEAASRMFQQVIDDTDTPDLARRAKLLLAGLLTREDRLNEATDLFEQLLRDPDAATIEMAASFFQYLGDADRAQQIMARLNAIDIAPELKAAVRAANAERLGDFDGAIAAMQEVIASGHARIPAWQQLASLQIRRGDVAAAIETAHKAVAKHPGVSGLQSLLDNQELALAVANQDGLRPMLLRILNDREYRRATIDALKILVDAQRNDRASTAVVVDLRQLADRHPRYLALQNLTVQMYLALGRKEDAADLAARTMRASPNAAEPAWMAAEVLAAAGRWSEALVVAEEWRRRASRQPLAADLMIAEAKMQLGRESEALDQLQPYVGKEASAGEQFAILRARARMLAYKGQHDDALALLEPMLAESSDYRQLLMRLAVLMTPDAQTAAAWLSTVTPYVSPNDTDDSLNLAQSWRALDERFGDSSFTDTARQMLSGLADAPAPSAKAIQMLAIIDEAEGRVDAAERGYRRALGLNPGLAVSQNNLAMFMLERGDAAEALRLAEGAVAAAPRAAAFQDTLALANIAAGRGEAAVTAARRAVGLQPRVLMWYITLAEAFLAADQPDEVRRVLEGFDRLQAVGQTLPDNLQRRRDAIQQRL